MPQLVGDVINKMRLEAPDPPQLLARPLSIAAVLSNGGGWSGGATGFFVATARNQWGETIATGEISIGFVNPTLSANVTVTVGQGVTAVRIYIGTTAGGENQYVEVPTPLGPGSYVQKINSPNPVSTDAVGVQGIPATPPVTNTAWLPDTDGSAIGAFQAYQWLNDGLTELAELAGGILDSTGLQGLVQNMYYVVPGRWYEITNIRWDNWPSWMAKRDEVFYRIILSGIPTLFTEEGRAGQQIIGGWPAPGGSGNTAILKGGAGGVGTNLLSTDASLIVDNALNFTVQQRVMIDQEVILYGQVVANPDGTFTLLGLVRGVGGTRAAVHVPNVTVTELKITVVGYRYASQYNVGDSAVQLDIPPSWDVPIHKYMRYRYLEYEQQSQEAAEKYKEFQQHGNRLRSQRMGAVRSRQMGPPLLLDGPSGAWEGRILIPMIAALLISSSLIHLFV